MKSWIDKWEKGNENPGREGKCEIWWEETWDMVGFDPISERWIMGGYM